MSVPMRKDDPAYFLLEQGLKNPEKQSVKRVYDSSCYICRDPEFALMGLPVCKPCPVPVTADNGIVTECGAHWAADDPDCDAGHSVQGYYEAKGY
jgi:hypothetical protein